ncbi:MAG: HD domain-containing protein [Peptococcaceae bacterium]|nr:HD domain-containing protein [Peptococcaceae bacterium]
MFYRIGQFCNALYPKIKTDEYVWLNSVLTPGELAIFYRQTLTEQRHALDVAMDIEEQKNELVERFGDVSYHCLLHASLLHDCGKSLFRLRLWQRVAIVAVNYLPEKWKNHISKRGILGKTMVIYQQHPAWGKRLASKAGLDKEIQTLIENHHQPGSPMEKVLFQADNRH